MQKVKISSKHPEAEESRQPLQVPESKSGSHPGESSGTAVKVTKRKRTNDSEDEMDDDVTTMETDEGCRHNLVAVAKELSEKLSLIQASDSDDISFMVSLPDELLLKIFKNLSLNTLINIAPVCKRWFVLSKDESLWLEMDAVYNKDRVTDFSRIVGATKHLRTVDVSFMHAEDGLGLPSLLNGLESVRRLSFSCLVIAPVIAELLERYKGTLEELTLSLSDERLSYGKGGTFKDGVEPRPGFLLKLISEMKNLRVLQLTAAMHPNIAYHQGRVNPKWYFGELENPELKLESIKLNFENPREILIQRFIIPFLRSKVSFLKELCLTESLWENKEIRALLKDFEKLKVLREFPIQYLSALKNLRQPFSVDLILERGTDFNKIKGDLADCEALSYIQEVSLSFPGELFIIPEEQVPDRRLETFLSRMAWRLKSCKRVHITRFPIQYLSALKNLYQAFSVDFILDPGTDFNKVQEDLADCEALSYIQEVSLSLPGELFIVPEEQEQVPDRRLETFLSGMAWRLKSCKRVHITRLGAPNRSAENVQSLDALKRFLCILRPTLEELNIADNLKANQSLPQIMKLVRENVPQLKARGTSVNRIGFPGLLYSTCG